MTENKDLVCIPREIELQAAMFRLGNINEEIQKGLRDRKSVV